MRDAGYFARRIAARPVWLEVPHVREICSVSECISEGAPGWIQSWRHNGFGWFNRIDDARAVIPTDRTHEYRLFAYRLVPEVFGCRSRSPLVWPEDVRPEPVPETFQRRGFDCMSRSTPLGLSFECSPLSCNGLASSLPVNDVCLFETSEAAVEAAIRFGREQPEPGDYYVAEVLEELTR